MVTGTKQLLNSLFGREGNLESDPLQSCLAWQMGEAHSRSAQCLQGSGSLDPLAYLCGQAEHLLHQLLCLRRLFQEQFHYCSQEGELHLRERGMGEIKNSAIQQCLTSLHTLCWYKTEDFTFLTALHSLFFSQYNETQILACCKTLSQTNP